MGWGKNNKTRIMKQARDTDSWFAMVEWSKAPD